MSIHTKSDNYKDTYISVHTKSMTTLFIKNLFGWLFYHSEGLQTYFS